MSNPSSFAYPASPIWKRPRINSWTLSVGAIALLLSLPVLTVFHFHFYDYSQTWLHLVEHLLPTYIVNSLLLSLGVAIGTFIIGVPAAWLCAHYQFPGKRLLEFLLLLPLAIPGYIIAYTYTGILDFSGPVQTFLREVFAWEYGDYWFPEIRSLGGAIVMLSLVLYPYVFLLTRAIFLDQSNALFEAATSLGANTFRRVRTVILPLARPGIVAGVSLALMETLADYGTVQYFGVDTFTTGIFRVWFGFGEPGTAAQLSSILVVFVLALLIIEKRSRRRARYHNPGLSQRMPEPLVLTGSKKWLATIACSIPPLFGFILPFLQLSYWAAQTAEEMVDYSFLVLALNSMQLAFYAALATLLLAILLSYARRSSRNHLLRSLVSLSGIGYAIPGTVIAVGVLVLFGAIDRQLNHWLNDYFAISIGLLFSGSLLALVFAHVVRFLSVSLQTVTASLSKINHSVDEASRVLGHSISATLYRIHIPLMRNGLLTAVLLVFVEVMKELPATLIMRPFNFNTLAVRAYELASDERLADASSAALAIVLFGILPVAFLNYSIKRRD